MLWKYCKNIVNITLFKWPKYIPFFLFPFLLFFLPFFSTVWLIDLSPPPFIILHLYLSFFPFKNFTFPMPSCLHVSSGNSFSFLMNTLLSFFFTNLLSPHKTLPLLLLSLTDGNNHGFFFWVKNSWRVLHCHRAVATPFFFFFFFLVNKNFAKHSLPKRNFHLKLSRTLMRVQHLTECYGWSFNNGDLVLWVYSERFEVFPVRQYGPVRV